jgi:hypothetical protein
MDKLNDQSSEMSIGVSGDIPGDISTNLELEELLKLLLDEDRLVILGLLAMRPHTIAELTVLLPDKRTPPAKHVAQLAAAGLLTQANDERYTLNVRQLQSWKRRLFSRPAQPVVESVDEQVLATFVRNGKMMQYPAQQSKRWVVLRWLASHFESGRDYQEREVNEILAGHSEDHATLRRYLVDHELLVRQEGIYQRP